MSAVLGTIVVGFDGGQGCHDALLLGQRLAAATGARLVAAFVYRTDREHSSADEEWEAWLRSVAEREVARAAEVAPGAECVTVGAPSVAEGLQRLAVERSAGLLVVGGTRRGPVGRLMLGTIAQRLLTGAPCPVAVAPHGWDATPRRLVVGYDGTAEARAALEFAAPLAAALEAPVEIVGVVESPPLVPEALELVRRRTEALTRAREAAVREAVELVRPIAGRVSGAVGRGDPGDVLIAHASTPETVLVVGSRAYGPVGAVLLGSVAAEVMHEAVCPVIVVPRRAA